ncbi:MAG TPA: malto-oligosyltrehalose synthase, partial [Paracoccaceae bacterium]|nr:malto-oligosyltrehalose synthase [Paracoccaceae bacterium]
MTAPLPTATYRLQFRGGMDFARAASIVPYLRDLGISHLYASPLFQATEGSTHGYDVTDHGRFDEALGGLDGFLALSDALRAGGLGLILDIVPNHMAASVQNPWWRDVLRNGDSSRYAGHFDIDWSAPNLILPILGRTYGGVLDAGDLKLGREPDGYALRYFEHAFPLSPATTAIIAEAAGTDAPDDAALERLSQDRDLIHRVHEAQNYRLAYWRLARDGLTNRRFFEIADLVGVRVEEPRIFDDVHAFLYEMIEAGRIDGVRIDHIDGLADPAGYLDRLARTLPRPVPVWVEKILARGERIPETWPVAGATGYEFADLACAVLTDASGIPALSEGYDDFTGTAHDYDEMRAAAKREILAQNLAAELAILTDHAEAALHDDPYGRDWGRDSLRRSLTVLLMGLPVYRTYLDGGDPSPADRAVLARARDAALAHAEVDDPAVIETVLRHIVHGTADADRRLRARFQQTGGALMAKAVEDTVFYRYNRLISANEVGGEPNQPALPPAVFHEEMGARARTAPAALNATATHDTKRGEDARTRIAAIAELPHVWLGAVAAFDRELDDRAQAIDAETRWLFYQGLLGAWETPAGQSLRDRTKAWLEKAARESKLRTSWLGPDEDYERTLMAFADAAFDAPRFLGLFDELAAPFLEIGRRKSLVQLALK